MGYGHEFDILYEDDRFVAITKPGGMLVHRSNESRDRVFVLQELREQLGRYLYPIHRLDRAASGVLLFALDSDAARAGQDALASDATRKEYLVLVRGDAADRWDIDRPLTDEGKTKKEARSAFVCLARFARCSLLRARIFTGRRHQLRRHLSYSRHQVIGDTTYGKGRINTFFRETYGLPRLFLHAHRLTLRQPFSGVTLSIESPLSGDLRDFLLRLPDFDPAALDLDPTVET